MIYLLIHLFVFIPLSLYVMTSILKEEHGEYTTWREIWQEKEARIMIGCALALPEVVIACVCGVVAFQYYKQKSRLRAEGIVRKMELWAINASDGKLTLHQYGDDNKIWKEGLMNSIREQMRSIPDKDLKFLGSLPKYIYEMERDFHRAVMDEIIERAILNA